MALQIPALADPRDPNQPVTNAYAWLASLAIDFRSNAGRIVFSVHPNEAAWQGQPITEIAATLGQDFGGGHVLPTLATLQADPEFAAAFAVIGRKLYTAAAAAVPALQGSTPC